MEWKNGGTKRGIELSVKFNAGLEKSRFAIESAQWL